MRARKVRVAVVLVVPAIAIVGALVWTMASGAGDDVARGGRIVFLRNGHAYLMNADGSAQRPTGLPSVPVWSPDGRRIAFYRADSRATRLYVANADGSGRREILRENPYNSCLDPAWSPDGKRLLYTLDCEIDFQQVGIVNRDGTGRKILTGTWSQNPAWSPGGRTILFTRAPDPRRGRFRLFLMNQRGREQRPVPGTYPDPEPTPHTGPEWSRDGKTSRANGSGLARPWVGDYVVNVGRSDLRQLTDNRVYDVEPRWSPDGRRIAFTSERDGNSEIYVMNADGSDQTNISRNPAGDWSPSWTPAP